MDQLRYDNAYTEIKGALVGCNPRYHGRPSFKEKIALLQILMNLLMLLLKKVNITQIMVS